MVKQNICNMIARETGISAETAKVVINKFTESIKSANELGESVFIRGFGSFIPKLRKAKKARNISKNETIEIPARNVPYFKPCKEYKNMVK